MKFTALFLSLILVFASCGAKSDTETAETSVSAPESEVTETVPAETETAIPQTMSITALGDSITRGYGLADVSGERFTSLVADEIEKSGMTPKIANYGVDGIKSDELLAELEAGDKPTLFAFNKCDAGLAPEPMLQLKQSARGENHDMVFISARTGAGLNQMIEKLETMAGAGKQRVHLFIPPAEGAVTGIIYQLGDDVEMDYREDGIYVTVTADDKLIGKIKKYITDPLPEPDEDEE